MHSNHEYLNYASIFYTRRYFTVSPRPFRPTEYPWALMLPSMCGIHINVHLQVTLPCRPLLPLAETAEPMPGNGGQPSVPGQSPSPT